MSDLLFTVPQHGVDDATWKLPISRHVVGKLMRQSRKELWVVLCSLYSVRPCIDHIPYYLSGLSPAQFFFSDNLSRNSWIPTTRRFRAREKPLFLERALAPKFQSSPLSNACYDGYTILPVFNCFFWKRQWKRNGHSNSGPAWCFARMPCWSVNKFSRVTHIVYFQFCFIKCIYLDLFIMFLYLDYFSLFPPADISLLIGENLLQRIRNTTHIWVVTRNQYGISALVSQTSFRGKSVVAFRNVGCFVRLGARTGCCRWVRSASGGAMKRAQNASGEKRFP